MSATSVPARGRRHPMTVVTAARRMAEQEGLRPQQIVDRLAQDGITVSLGGVIRWTRPSTVEAHRQRNRRRRRRLASQNDGRIATHIVRHVTPEFKMARIRALAERLNYADVAVVMEFDFGDALTGSMVRYALQVDRYPLRFNPRKVES